MTCSLRGGGGGAGVGREASPAWPGDAVALAQRGACTSKTQRGQLCRPAWEGRWGFEEPGPPALLFLDRCSCLCLLHLVMSASEPGAQPARSQASGEVCCVDTVDRAGACLWENLNSPQQTGRGLALVLTLSRLQLIKHLLCSRLSH